MASSPTAIAPVKRACDRYVSLEHSQKPDHSLCQSIAVTEGRLSALTVARLLVRTVFPLVLHVHTMRFPRRKVPRVAAPKFYLSFAKFSLLLESQSISTSVNRQSLLHLLARQACYLPTLVEGCIEHFFIHVYPLEPVLHRQRAQEAAVGMEHSIEAYCMIAALCAYVMIQANHKPPISVLPHPELARMSNVGISHVLLEESVRVRQSYDHQENPTHMSVLTSWFYSGCYSGLARENTAWTYLRYATTQAQLLGMHDEETYKHDPLDTSRKRVLYWLLFIAERCDCGYPRHNIFFENCH